MSSLTPALLSMNIDTMNASSRQHDSMEKVPDNPWPFTTSAAGGIVLPNPIYNMNGGVFMQSGNMLEQPYYYSNDNPNTYLLARHINGMNDHMYNHPHHHIGRSLQPPSFREEPKSLLDMPAEIMNMILEMVVLQHEPDLSRKHHPDPKVIVTKTNPNKQAPGIPEYLTPVRTTSIISIAITAVNRGIRRLSLPHLRHELSLKTFYFADLDVFWSFHHHHPLTAKSIKNIDVTAYGQMTFAGMALLLRHELDTVTLRSAPVVWQSSYEDYTGRLSSLILGTYLATMFAHSKNTCWPDWEPLLIETPDGLRENESMDRNDPYFISDSEAYCTDCTLIGDAIEAAFTNKLKAFYLEPAPLIPKRFLELAERGKVSSAELTAFRNWQTLVADEVKACYTDQINNLYLDVAIVVPKRFRGLVEQGKLSWNAFADEKKGWLTDVVVDMFAEGPLMKIDEKAFAEKVTEMQFLISIWKMVDADDG